MIWMKQNVNLKICLKMKRLLLDYHVLYIARNPVTAESVRIKVKRALGNNSISHIEIVDSVEYYFQYLTHESSDAIKKNKHKYDKKDIRYINDFDIDRYVTLDESIWNY
ncbi:Rep family protein [Enterococcus lactis]|uniref:Rep family protein n=1 Tax=Enterococcus lactis TaxID=357441 RepID=UPI002FD7CCE2